MDVKEPTSLISKVKTWYEESKGDVSVWEQNQSKWHKLRMRIKKTKSYPFKGCSNLRMPTLEIKIRKLKAGLMNAIFGVRPIIQAIPTPSGNWQDAQNVEKFLDHLIMDCIKIKPKATISIDKTVEQGFYLLKPYWRREVQVRKFTFSIDDLTFNEAALLFSGEIPQEEVVKAFIDKIGVDKDKDCYADNLKEAERVVDAVLSGEKEVEYKIKDVVYNYPDVALCPPERVYVPSTSGFDPQGCEYIIHEFFVPLSVAKQNIYQKAWKEISVKEIESVSSDTTNDKTLDQDKDKQEGISRLKRDGTIRVWEVYYWEQSDTPKKMVLTCAPDFNAELKRIELPFFSGKYPFVKTYYELIDDRWFSHRGLPELIEDIVKEIDVQHMQKIDYGTLSNSPTFLYRSGAVSQNTMQFAFGQGIPVTGMQELKDVISPMQFQNPNVPVTYEREQMILETKIEELVGQIDYSLQSMINKRQPRTFGEVQMQAGAAQQVFSLDADMFRSQWEEVFNWIWELWCQYGDDNAEFQYFGVDGYQTIKLNREEVQGKYKITLRANDQNTNPQIKLQKAQQILLGVTSPVALQTGVVNPMNVYNGMKRFYQEMDIQGWQELISQPQPQQPPVPNIRTRFTDLTDKEQAQVLQKQGIQPDPEGRQMRDEKRMEDDDWNKFLEERDMGLEEARYANELMGGTGGQ